MSNTPMTPPEKMEIDIKVGSDAEPHSPGQVELAIDPGAEKRLLRKLDMFLSPMMVLFFLVAYLDRSNIGKALRSVFELSFNARLINHAGNAAVAGMTTDLNLEGNQLNVAVTVFYVTYIAFEIPASLALKKLRASRLIPFFIIAWSAVIIGSAFIRNYAGLLATRLLLGAFESGLFPCLTLYLSTFYKKEEQARRISYLFVASALSGAFGGLLAYGLTGLHGAKSLAGWRWLFLVEGLISVVVGIVAVFLLPDNFETAWWLREDEKALMRIRHEQTKVYLGQSETLDKAEVALAFKDPKVWLSAWCQFCADTCSFGFGTFLPIIIRGFGYDSVRTQLLTVPVYIWAACVYIAISFMSDRFNRRGVFMVPMALITAVGYAILLGVPMTSTGPLYFGTFVTATGIYCVVGLNVTWLSNSNAGYFKRATAIGLQQTIGNSAGIMVSPRT
ncbi:hypothetical protein SLS62_009565 [Diatrype stigma]|uniref:Major facilitator superfamily (MFS) profile domain-containing protein n=1 Tax=Diatrype stigma TaxID=117547 RepID=A0AAN9YKV2_9PEZI